MKKAELMKLLEAVPDDADIQMADFERCDTNEISGIVPPEDYSNWYSRASIDHAVDQKIWIII